LNNGSEFVIAPNPANAVTEIRLQSNVTENAQVIVVNQMGQIVSTTEVNLVSGDNTFTLNVDALGNGLYTVLLKGDTINANQKLQIVK
jgi:hypothetical protein